MRLREQIFANQKKLGVIPPDAKLTPWPRPVAGLGSICRPRRRSCITRQVEVYAAYLAYTDHEIGRVIQAVEDLGKLDNTTGHLYQRRQRRQRRGHARSARPTKWPASTASTLPVEVQLAMFYDKWGSDKTYNHMAVGWTWAFDTPFQMDQASRLALRRHAPRDVHRVA